MSCAKQVYGEFKAETKINITNAPSETDITDFWSNIWSRKKVYNVNAPWLKILEQEYCANVTQEHYEVNLDIFLKILTKTKNNTAPGIDLIVASWWKKLFCLHGPLVGIFGKMCKNELEISQWEPLQSVSWILPEFYFNRGLQRLYTGTCIILQKTINGFLCLLIVFLKSKTYQLILKDVIKLNRNLR